MLINLNFDEELFFRFAIVRVSKKNSKEKNRMDSKLEANKKKSLT